MWIAGKLETRQERRCSAVALVELWRDEEAGLFVSHRFHRSKPDIRQLSLGIDPVFICEICG